MTKTNGVPGLFVTGDVVRLISQINALKVIGRANSNPDLLRKLTELDPELLKGFRHAVYALSQVRGQVISAETNKMVDRAICFVYQWTDEGKDKRLVKAVKWDGPLPRSGDVVSFDTSVVTVANVSFHVRDNFPPIIFVALEEDCENPDALLLDGFEP